MVVYLIVNTNNSKVYVGKTERPVALRWAEHIEDSVRRPHLAPLLYRAMHKYGANAFIFSVVAEAVTAAQLNELERLWIWMLRSAQADFGYNLTLGGSGGKPNAATLEKLRQPKTLAHRLALGAAMSVAAKRRGTAHMNTVAARNRKSVTLTGRVFSEATRLKMAASAQARRARELENGIDHMSKARSARNVQHRDGKTGKFTS